MNNVSGTYFLDPITGIFVLWLKSMFSDTPKRQRSDSMSCSEPLTDFALVRTFQELFYTQNLSKRCYVYAKLLLHLKARHFSALPTIKFQMDRMSFRVLSGYNNSYMNHDDLLNILCLLLPPICLKIQQDASCAGLLFLI
jgi:hypothetical protein